MDSSASEPDVLPQTLTSTSSSDRSSSTPSSDPSPPFLSKAPSFSKLNAGAAEFVPRTTSSSAAPSPMLSPTSLSTPMAQGDLAASFVFTRLAGPPAMMHEYNAVTQVPPPIDGHCGYGYGGQFSGGLGGALDRLHDRLAVSAVSHTQVIPSAVQVNSNATFAAASLNNGLPDEAALKLMKQESFVMAKDEIVTVKAAIQKLQLYLLDGIQDEDKLFAAGAVMSQSDYHDVVIERSIANICGYPLCGNTLPSERPRKGKYRISLKEHKVYDLQETYMYCFTNCVVSSRAFATSLQEERSSDIKPAKLNEVLRLFAGMSLDDSKEGLKKDKKSVLSDLRVQEKSDLEGGDVSMEEWIGPSCAIEGYVPKRDNTIKPQQPKLIEKGEKAKKSHKQNKGKNVVFSEMDFTSAILMQDEYNVSKSREQTMTIGNLRNKEEKNKMKSDHREGESTELGESALCKSSSVAIGESDVFDVVTDARLIILPPPHEVDGAETLQEGDIMLDTEQAPLKWPSKLGLLDSDLFESDDSWFDSPPDGFSLTLSPFSTMFTALFAWTSSSSLAYIYGHDETLHKEYLLVNGREHPRKAVAIDDRSPEIRQALAGCLALALPGVVADLRLPTPLSTLEREMGHLLDTMSFMDPIPALKMKQWHLLVLLLLDALSVCRIPALAPYMTGRRVWLPKVLGGAKISAEEYEIMKDLIIPLGRVPQFVMQSDG